MRCDYFMATLNPDDPSLPVYKEYINCSRPLPHFKNDAPKEINNMLCEEPKPNWVHWFFSFTHNAGLSTEKIEQIKLNVPKGTKLWKNKIQGLRGRATGLVFSNFDVKHIVSREYAKKFIQGENGEIFKHFSAGLDTAYSDKSPDTIAMSYIGITNKGICFVLDERVYNNAELQKPLAPSDTAINFIDFLKRNTSEWGLARNVFIDSADQATITELQKYKLNHSDCIYIFNNSYKRITNVDRINLQLGWFAKDNYLIVDSCKNYIRELEVYSWREDKDNTPEDNNDHMINSTQYAWIPYKAEIGVNR